MGSRAVAASSLLLRIVTLLALLACMLVLITNNFRDPLFNDGSKVTFKDLSAYRFVFSTAVIGAACTFLQLPYAFYNVWKEKRLISDGCWPEFDIYAGKITSFLLATGVGAGFAVSFELKNLFDDLFSALAEAGIQQTEVEKSIYDKFLTRGIVATGLLLFGFVCMAVVLVLSTMNRTSSSGFSR